MKDSKTTKSLKNVFFGFFSQIIVILLNFLARTIFIKILSEEYLGINGLFSNVLNVLSLTDLGFSGAIIYCLYKPLVEKDKNKIARLMNYYKKLYVIFAIIILLIGLCLIPSLKFLVNLPNNIPNIVLYYVMFLINTVASYLFAYKNAILEADQKNYILRIYTVISSIVQFVLQLIILYFFHNYFLYLVVQLFCTVLNNILGAIKVNKLYPFLKKTKLLITKSEKKDIYKNVGGVFVNKLSNIILLNTDNILISMLVGTLSVGYYSNYSLIVNAIITFISIIFTSIYGSIGQFNVENNSESKYKIFKSLNVISFIITGTCSICFLILFQDFINIWIGKNFLLNNEIVIVIVLNFYLNEIVSPINLFRDTTGIFNDTKYIYLFTCILNILFSILLGKKFGIFGILFATVISKIITSFWFDPYIIYKKIFKKNCVTYFFHQLIQFIIIVVVYFLVLMIYNFLNLDVNIFSFVIKSIITFISSFALLVIICYNTVEFEFIKDRILKTLKR